MASSQISASLLDDDFRCTDSNALSFHCLHNSFSQLLFAFTVVDVTAIVFDSFSGKYLYSKLLSYIIHRKEPYIIDQITDTNNSTYVI